MKSSNKSILVFNSALEIGNRILFLLCAAYPISLDIQKIIRLDYLMLHSADAEGPSSLHVSVRTRSGELLVKHDLIKRGLYLMISKGLIMQIIESDGFKYIANDSALPYLSSLQSKYFNKLKERSEWVSTNFLSKSIRELDKITNEFFGQWELEFQKQENAH